MSMAYTKSKNWGNISNKNYIAELNRTCRIWFFKMNAHSVSLYCNLARVILSYSWEIYIGWNQELGEYVLTSSRSAVLQALRVKIKCRLSWNYIYLKIKHNDVKTNNRVGNRTRMGLRYLKHHRPQRILVDDALPGRWHVWLLHFIYVGGCCFLCNKQKCELNGRAFSRTEWHRNTVIAMIFKISSGISQTRCWESASIPTAAGRETLREAGTEQYLFTSRTCGSDPLAGSW